MLGRKTLIFLGLSSLVTLSISADAPVQDLRADSKDKPNQQPENEKKKPNILKDYVCFRDGELCHPEFAKNRGMYVSCSNGIAWEQQCPKCVYHPLACPTRSLWFDGEKCDWASPKLASQPCIDKVQLSPYDQEQSLFQSMESFAQPNYDYHPADKNSMNRWPANKPQMPYPQNQGPSQLKPSKQKFSPEYVDSDQVRTDPKNELESSHDPFAQLEKSEPVKSPADIEFPPYLRLDDSPPMDGTKMIKLREPVYTVVDSDDGKPVIMKIAEPFVLEEPARDPLPNVNIISSDSSKD